jgi:hypothetical protein
MQSRPFPTERSKRHPGQIGEDLGENSACQIKIKTVISNGPWLRPFAGMLDRHPRSASRRSACFSLALSLGSPPFLAPLSVVLADDDGQRVVTVGAQGPVLRVVGEDHAVGAQPVDEGSRTVRARHLS